MKATALAYSTKEINRNFRIKVAGVDNNGNKINISSACRVSSA